MRIIQGIMMLIVIGLFTSISAQSLNLIHEKSFDVQKGQLFELQSDVGDIKVRTWDKDEVHIKVYGDRDAEDDVEFFFKETSRGVLVEADEHGGWNWFNGIRVKYEIDVPINFNLDMNTSGGNIVVVDLLGDVITRTSGGDIDFENVKGKMKVSTSGGNVRLLKVEGNIDASTSGGDIDINSSNGKVEASTSGGNISFDYTGDNQGVELGTSGGDVTIKVSKDFNAEIYLRTSGGDIECDLEARIKEVNDNKFIGSMNGGGPELTAKTSGGNIRVFAH